METVNLTVGGKPARFLPEFKDLAGNAVVADPLVEWSSSDPIVAVTVDDATRQCEIVGLAPGTALVRAKVKDLPDQVLIVNVVGPPASTSLKRVM